MPGSFDGAVPPEDVELIQSLIIANKHFSATVSHTASSVKSEHHFLLLHGLIWCSSDVIVFTVVGPLILFNLQQTGAVVTAGCPSVCLSVCLSAAAVSMLSSALWFRSPGLVRHRTTAPIPMFPLLGPLVVTSADRDRLGRVSCDPAGPLLARHPRIQRAPLQHANKPIAPLLRLFSIRPLEREAGQQKHQCVFS